MLYATSVYLMFALLPVSYGYVLAISLLATVAHVRLFMIGHDCAHQSYLPRKGWLNIMGTNFGMVIYYGALISFFGLESVLLVFAPILLMSSNIAVWLFYIQHQFDEAYWEREETWDYRDATLKGSSFYNLPRWLHWATGNIGYHHLHHLNPKIPNYKLATCHYSDPMLQEGKSITFWESFRLANLALWDESARRLISFAEFDRTSEPTR